MPFPGVPFGPFQDRNRKFQSWSQKTFESTDRGTEMFKRSVVSVAMPADSRREKIFDFAREFAVKYFRIVPVRDSTQQNKA